MMLLTDIVHVFLLAQSPWHENCAAEKTEDGAVQVLLHGRRGTLEYELREQFPPDGTYMVQMGINVTTGDFTARPVTMDIVPVLDVVVVFLDRVEIHRFRAVEKTPGVVSLTEEVIWAGADTDVPEAYAEAARKALEAAQSPAARYVT